MYITVRCVIQFKHYMSIVWTWYEHYRNSKLNLGAFEQHFQTWTNVWISFKISFNMRFCLECHLWYIQLIYYFSGYSALMLLHFSSGHHLCYFLVSYVGFRHLSLHRPNSLLLFIRIISTRATNYSPQKFGSVGFFILRLIYTLAMMH